LLTASESKEKFCLSVIDPSRPAWFVRHYGYYLYLEPEYSPRNAHIFDQDASFFATADKFATGFMSFESVNYPDHYIQATDDGRMKISKFQDSEKFRNSASFYLHGHFLRGTSTKPIVSVLLIIIIIGAVFGRAMVATAPEKTPHI